MYTVFIQLDKSICIKIFFSREAEKKEKSYIFMNNEQLIQSLKSIYRLKHFIDKVYICLISWEDFYKHMTILGLLIIRIFFILSSFVMNGFKMYHVFINTYKSYWNVILKQYNEISKGVKNFRVWKLDTNLH